MPSRHTIRPAAPVCHGVGGQPPARDPAAGGALPKAPPGFRVSLFFQDGTAPRQLRAAPNGDLFLAESYAGQVRVLRPDGKGGLATTAVFATGRYRPFGIAFYPPGPNPAWVYVADNDKVVRYPYAIGDLTARGPAQTVVPSLPQGGQLPGGGHWTRDLAFARDGSRLYVSVGSFSNDQNDGEDETGRADVLSFAPDGSGRQVVADGIRNPVSLAVEPRSGELWATVNERDGLGDNLVPDYVTRVRQGQFFGWPWYYLGRNLDPRHASDAPQVGHRHRPRPPAPGPLGEPRPDVLRHGPFPGRYRNGAFVALHGSWNRANRTGSKVVFAKVKDGAPAKRYEDFLTGFTVAGAGPARRHRHLGPPGRGRGGPGRRALRVGRPRQRGVAGRLPALSHGPRSPVAGASPQQHVDPLGKRALGGAGECGSGRHGSPRVPWRSSASRPAAGAEGRHRRRARPPRRPRSRRTRRRARWPARSGAWCRTRPSARRTSTSAPSRARPWRSPPTRCS